MAALALLAAFTTHAQTVDPLTNCLPVSYRQIAARGLAYLDGLFVAVGGVGPTNVAVSTNGLNWVGAFTGGLSNSSEYLFAVDAAVGQFVAVGMPHGIVLNSPDGFQWTRRYWQQGVEFWAVTHGGGLFVVIGFDQSQKAVAGLSPDGVQWEFLPLPQFNTTPRNIAHGNGRFVAVGAPFSLTSTNGRDWEAIPSLLAQGVAFGNGRFLATSAAVSYTSTNGLDWTPLPFPGAGTSTTNYYTAGFGNGLFMAGGYADRFGLLAVLGDGPVRRLPTLTGRVGFQIVGMGPIRDVIFAEGRYYLADQYGVIWRSGLVTPVAPPRITRVTRENAQTSLTLSTIPGFRYAVETADEVDATNWQPLTPAAISATDNELHLIDPQPDRPARFYRARTE